MGRLDHLEAAASSLINVVSDSGTFDVEAVDEVRRKERYPSSILLVAEYATPLQDVINACIGTEYEIQGVNNTGAFENWFLWGVIRDEDSDIPFKIVSAYENKYDSFKWFLTGSQSEVNRLVDVAAKQGYTLNINGLFSGETAIALDETDIYSELGEPYKIPENR